MAFKSGIYIITNTLNNKVYIGQSTNINKRLSKHKRELFSNTHFNSHLQLSYNLHAEQFTFTPLLYCSISDLDLYEIRLIRSYRASERQYGYNNECGGSLNKIVSEETKRKLSLAQTGKTPPNKGVPCTAETKARISASKTGCILRPRTEEEKQRISESNKGQKRSDETKLNMSLSHQGPRPYQIGRKHSDEAKQKVSEANKGRSAWNRGIATSEEDKEKLRKPKNNTEKMRKPKSEEHRKNISLAQIGRVPWNKGIKKDK